MTSDNTSGILQPDSVKASLHGIADPLDDNKMLAVVLTGTMFVVACVGTAVLIYSCNHTNKGTTRRRTPQSEAPALTNDHEGSAAPMSSLPVYDHYADSDGEDFGDNSLLNIVAENVDETKEHRTSFLQLADGGMNASTFDLTAKPSPNHETDTRIEIDRESDSELERSENVGFCSVPDPSSENVFHVITPVTNNCEDRSLGIGQRILKHAKHMSVSTDSGFQGSMFDLKSLIK